MLLPKTKIIIIDDPKGSMKIYNLPSELFTSTTTFSEGDKK